MPNINQSTLGYINQTLKYPQPASPISALEIGFDLIIILFGLTVNGLIGFVLMINKKLRSETIAPAIISLIGANFCFLLDSIGWLFSTDTRLGCKIFGTLGYALMLCSALNLFGIGILSFSKFYFLKNISEESFRMVCKFFAISAWIVSVTVSFPTSIGQWGQINIECNSRACRITNVNADGSNTGYSLSKAYFTSYIIVGISNIFLNIAIYYRIQNYFKTIVSEIGNFSPETAMDYLRKEKETAKMIAADCVLYVFFPIPRALLYMIEEYPEQTVTDSARAIALVLWGSTAIVEPVLLLAFKEKYRKEIKKILKGAYSSARNKFSISPSVADTSITD